jgi:small subunit ribosomal protein S8
MSLNDPLANMFSQILNAERVGKQECKIKQGSKLLLDCLKILKDHEYVADFKLVKTNQGNVIQLQLKGQINKCNAIKPRFSIKKDGYEKFERRYLPAKDFGILIISTPKGLMTHHEAMEKGLGGKLIAYCY